MSHIQKILSDERIRQLCLSALADARGLDEALKAICRAGFAGTPQLEGAEDLFTERLKQVRAEYTAQLASYLSDPAGWTAKQRTLAEDPKAMACALGVLTGSIQGSPWEKGECFRLLDRRMETDTSAEEDQALVELFTRTRAAALFVGGRVPRIRAGIAPQFAGLLAMCSYVSVKREPGEGILPDLSFDAVCVWSNAMTDVLCVRDGAARDAAATVGCVMTAQYAHISQWEVLRSCMEHMPSLSSPTMEGILDLLREEVLSHAPDREGLYRMAWVWPEEPTAGLSAWLSELWQQRSSLQQAPPDEQEELEEELEESQEEEEWE